MLLARVATAIEHPSCHHLVEQRLHAAVSDDYRSLRRAVRRLGVPEFEADDVVQKAFVAFYRKASPVHPRANAFKPKGARWAARMVISSLGVLEQYLRPCGLTSCDAGAPEQAK